jgi:ferritin-like metal-binding protein YciE
MKGQDRLQTKLIQYMEDAHAMEQNVLRMLDSMITSTTDPEIKAMLEHHQEETEQQSERLRLRLEAMGEGTSAVKDLGAQAGALPKGLLDQLRGDKPGRNARDGYATEHLEIAAYQLLERVALRAGDQETAKVARLNRSEEEEMARKIDRTWDRVVDLTLSEEGAVRDTLS